MERKKKTLDLVLAQGIIPVFFHRDSAVNVQILKTLYKAGFRVVEYLNRDEHAINNFLQLKKVADNELHDLQVGVGTIRNKIEATEFINEGADFIVSPGVSEAVAGLAHKNNILWVPGCLTATEIMQADDLDAPLIKLFPANLLGPSYLAAMKSIFPGLLFMPTNGVTTNEENLSSWFKSGASAVGLMSSLVPQNLLAANDFDGIASLGRQTLQLVKEIRNR